VLFFSLHFLFLYLYDITFVYMLSKLYRAWKKYKPLCAGNVHITTIRRVMVGNQESIKSS